MMDIDEIGAVVTGGSRGLGKEIARALVRRGAKVVMVARGAEALDAAVRDVRADARRGGEAHGLAFDVGDKDAVHRIAGAANALVGDVDLLVHAASTLGPLPMPTLLETECEDFEDVLRVNLLGPFRLTKAIAGAMALRGHGVVLFASSDAAVSAYARWGAYGISKAAQDHLARTLAVELDPVRFFAVDPGDMDTKMHADAVPDADRSTLARPEDVALRFMTIIQRAEQVANGSRLLASDVPADAGASEAA